MVVTAALLVATLNPVSTEPGQGHSSAHITAHPLPRPSRAPACVVRNKTLRMSDRAPLAHGITRRSTLVARTVGFMHQRRAGGGGKAGTREWTLRVTNPDTSTGVWGQFFLVIK